MISRRAVIQALGGLATCRASRFPATVPNEAAADGVGELWFDSAEAMQQAMNSPEMAAVEDAKRFLDMQRTYALVVDEKTMIGQEVLV